MKLFTIKRAVVPLTLLAALFVIGCEREGPAERAGESLDRGVENAGDAMERAGDRARDRTR